MHSGDRVDECVRQPLRGIEVQTKDELLGSFAQTFSRSCNHAETERKRQQPFQGFKRCNQSNAP